MDRHTLEARCAELKNPLLFNPSPQSGQLEKKLNHAILRSSRKFLDPFNYGILIRS